MLDPLRDNFSKNLNIIVDLSRFMLIIMTVLLLLFHFSASAAALSTAEWEEDIDYLAEKLPELHKNLFFKTTQSRFEGSISALKVEISQLSDIEVVLRLKEIVSQIGDPHTTFNYNAYLNYYYPVSFKNFGNGYRVMTVEKDNQELLGAELISINGFTPNELKNRLKRFTALNNESAQYFKINGMLNLPELLSYAGIIDVENKIYKLRKDEKIYKVTFKERRTSEAAAYRDQVVQLQYQPSRAYKNADKLFWAEYISQEKALYFQYNLCWSRELEKEYRENDNPELPYFSSVEMDIINKLENRDVEKFIIDLRHNAGGASAQGTAFAERLAEYKEDVQTFVIIGPRTFSSAVINAVDFREKLEGFLVGRPAAAKPNHYGEVKSFNLPNSGLRISYSSKYFRVYNDKEPDALYPDIYVDTEFEDFVNGEDTILNLIFR